MRFAPATAFKIVALSILYGQTHAQVQARFRSDECWQPSRHGISNVLKRFHDGTDLVGLSTRSHGKKKLSKRHWRLLKEELRREPRLYLREMQHALHVRVLVFYSISAILRTLKQHAYTWKRVQYRAAQRSASERRDYMQCVLNPALFDPELTVCIDESHLKPEMDRASGWGERGTRITLAQALGGGQACSLLAACNVDGMVPSACAIFDTSDAAIDTTRFLSWVETCLLPVLGNFQLRQKNSIVLADNATIHHSDEFIDMIESVGAKVVFLPPYSPDYNPIEIMFGAMKRHVTATSLSSDRTVEERATDALYSISPDQARRYYRKCYLNVAPPAADAAEADEDSEAVAAWWWQQQQHGLLR